MTTTDAAATEPAEVLPAAPPDRRGATPRWPLRPAVLAHAGGAPEALRSGAPVLFLAVFAVMERRARAR